MPWGKVLFFLPFLFTVVHVHICTDIYSSSCTYTLFYTTNTQSIQKLRRDLRIAENLSGPTSKNFNQIRTLRAVVLSNAGQWEESSKIFEQVIQKAEKNACKFDVEQVASHPLSFPTTIYI